tara:strand:- start:4360 stop:4743 length:384 start_codon:yes stop_codon:yes gene_type:complete
MTKKVTEWKSPTAQIRALKKQVKELRAECSDHEQNTIDINEDRANQKRWKNEYKEERDRALEKLATTQNQLTELQGWERHVREIETAGEIKPVACPHEWRGMGDRVLCDKCGLIGEVPQAQKEYGFR